MMTETTQTTTTTTPTTTTTTITTTTATETLTVPTPTVYAQCQPDNIIRTANGGQYVDTINIRSADGVSFVDFVTITDPVACCVQCAQDPTCVAYLQFPDGPGGCSLVVTINGRCDGAEKRATFVTSQLVTLASGFTIGDGGCGQYTNGGSV